MGKILEAVARSITNVFLIVLGFSPGSFDYERFFDRFGLQPGFSFIKAHCTGRELLHFPRFGTPAGA